MAVLKANYTKPFYTLCKEIRNDGAIWALLTYDMRLIVVDTLDKEDNKNNGY